jgi:hypothetical protein
MKGDFMCCSLTFCCQICEISDKLLATRTATWWRCLTYVLSSCSLKKKNGRSNDGLLFRIMFFLEVSEKHAASIFRINRFWCRWMQRWLVIYKSTNFWSTESSKNSGSKAETGLMLLYRTTPYFRMVSNWPARTNSIAYDTKTLHMCLIKCNIFTPSTTDYVAKRRGQLILCYVQVTMLLYVNLLRRGKNPQWLMHTYVFKLCAQTNDRGRSD